MVEKPFKSNYIHPLHWTVISFTPMFLVEKGLFLAARSKHGETVIFAQANDPGPSSNREKIRFQQCP